MEGGVCKWVALGPPVACSHVWRDWGHTKLELAANIAKLGHSHFLKSGDHFYQGASWSFFFPSGNNWLEPSRDHPALSPFSQGTGSPVCRSPRHSLMPCDDCRFVHSCYVPAPTQIWEPSSLTGTFFRVPRAFSDCLVQGSANCRGRV